MFLSTISTGLLKSSRDGDSTTSLGSLFQCLTAISVKKFFLSKENIQSKHPLIKLEAIDYCLISSCLGEVTNTHLTTNALL